MYNFLLSLRDDLQSRLPQSTPSSSGPPLSTSKKEGYLPDPLDLVDLANLFHAIKIHDGKARSEGVLPHSINEATWRVSLDGFLLTTGNRKKYFDTLWYSVN